MGSEWEMKTIRERFEEIWPVPEGVYWHDGFCEYMPTDPASEYHLEAAVAIDLRLDTFTRCQETTALYLCLIDELVQLLQWYVDEDEIHEGDPENKYWVDGKHEAEALLYRAKQIMEQKK
jgi:hypothetical protein